MGPIVQTTVTEILKKRQYHQDWLSHRAHQQVAQCQAAEQNVGGPLQTAGLRHRQNNDSVAHNCEKSGGHAKRHSSDIAVVELRGNRPALTLARWSRQSRVDRTDHVSAFSVVLNWLRCWQTHGGLLFCVLF